MARVGANSARLDAAGSAEIDAWGDSYTPNRLEEEEADGDELAT